MKAPSIVFALRLNLLDPVGWNISNSKDDSAAAVVGSARMRFVIGICPCRFFIGGRARSGVMFVPPARVFKNLCAADWIRSVDVLLSAVRAENQHVDRLLKKGPQRFDVVGC